VAKGDRVARLDPAPFRAEVDGARASLSRAQARLKNAKIELERSQTLFKQGHIAKARLDQDVADAEVAAAEVSSAKAALARALVEIAQARGTSVNQMVTEIDQRRDGNLSSAIRVFVLSNAKETARPIA